MGINKLYTFAQSSQNILSDEQYQNDQAREQGNTLGSIARSALVNKVLKQTAAVSNAIGQVITNSTSSDVDDSDPSSIAAALSIALRGLYVASFSVQNNIWSFTIPEIVGQNVNVYAFIAVVNTDSVDEQQAKINDSTVKVILTSNNKSMVAADIVATQSQPLPVLFVVANESIYRVEDVSAYQVSQMNENISNVSSVANNALSIAEGAQAAANAAKAVTDTKGTASGLASLNSDAKVAASQSSSKIVIVRAAKTFSSGDAGTMQYCQESNVTITIPVDASNAAFPIGTEIEVVRGSDYTVTFVAQSGVNILSVDSAKSIADKFGVVCLKKVSATSWLLAGDLE